MRMLVRGYRQRFPLRKKPRLPCGIGLSVVPTIEGPYDSFPFHNPAVIWPNRQASRLGCPDARRGSWLRAEWAKTSFGLTEFRNPHPPPFSLNSKAGQLAGSGFQHESSTLCLHRSRGSLSRLDPTPDGCPVVLKVFRQCRAGGARSQARSIGHWLFAPVIVPKECKSESSKTDGLKMKLDGEVKGRQRIQQRKRR